MLPIIFRIPIQVFWGVHVNLQGSTGVTVFYRVFRVETRQIPTHSAGSASEGSTGSVRVSCGSVAIVDLEAHIEMALSTLSHQFGVISRCAVL